MLPLGAAKFNCTSSIVLFFVSGTKHVTYKIALKFLQTGPQETKATGNYNGQVKTCKNFHKNRNVPKIKKTAPPMASLICGYDTPIIAFAIQLTNAVIATAFGL